jgi:hypothetical protein
MFPLFISEILEDDKTFIVSSVRSFKKKCGFSVLLKTVRVDYSEGAADSGFMSMIYGICFRGY